MLTYHNGWETWQRPSELVYKNFGDFYMCSGLCLLSGGEEPESEGPSAELRKEHIPHVYFKQYLPVSNKVVISQLSVAGVLKY